MFDLEIFGCSYSNVKTQHNGLETHGFSWDQATKGQHCSSRLTSHWWQTPLVDIVQQLHLPVLGSMLKSCNSTDASWSVETQIDAKISALRGLPFCLFQFHPSLLASDCHKGGTRRRCEITECEKKGTLKILPSFYTSIILLSKTIHA